MDSTNGGNNNNSSWNETDDNDSFMEGGTHGTTTSAESTLENACRFHPGKEPLQTETHTFRQTLYHQCGEMNVLALIGLVIAGLAGTLIADIFGMFNVDCFLRAYQLPMAVFRIGSAIFAVINTANDVAGAYFVDWYASKNGQRRDQLVGLSGTLYAMTFLTPFFRWKKPSKPFWDGLHFVGSLSLYDTLFSFNCILQGSIVSDNHSMTQGQRITFFVCKDLVGILAPMVVTKIGLSLFNVSNLRPFRIYAVALALVSSLLALLGQRLINGNGAKNINGKNAKSGYTEVNGVSELGMGVDSHSNGSEDNEFSSSDRNSSELQVLQVLKDFVAHPNFRYWIVMEMLMEMQNTFSGNFQKTFVDQLLYQGSDKVGWSREVCDWILALLDPSTQIVGLFLFLPIRKYGYARCYQIVFASNIGLASMLLITHGFHYSSSTSTTTLWPIATFLVSTSVLSNAMAGAGFGLAMCDMVLEMKHSHMVIQNRKNPPSLAGLFMGVNALFCKPAESVLPILTASFLGDVYNFENDDVNVESESSTILDDSSKTVLYRLLVIPPLVCVVLQLSVWSKYSLVPARTEQLRQELEAYENNRRAETLEVHDKIIDIEMRRVLHSGDDSDDDERHYSDNAHLALASKGSIT